MERNINKYEKILIAVDKFKGSLSSSEAAKAIERGIIEAGFTSSQVIKVDMADGGDGSLEAVEAILGSECKRERAFVTGPLGGKVECEYLVKGDEAFIEMAKVCGLVMVPQELRDPTKTTTFGLGELIVIAGQRGASKIFLSIGGSATNDCGAGALQALGYKFYDANREPLKGPMCGGDLASVAEIIAPAHPCFNGEISVICDVTNPLLGQNGATEIYGRQKGADDKMVAQLEAGMRNFAQKAVQFLKTGGAQTTFEGAGAAGGVGFALKLFAGAKLIKGEDFFVALTMLEQKIGWADLVIGGEGSIDNQSFCGKVVGWLSALCKKHDKELYLFCGVNKTKAPFNQSKIFALSDIEPNIELSMSRAFELLSKRAAMAFKRE